MTGGGEEGARVFRTHPAGAYVAVRVGMTEELRARGAVAAQEAGILLRHAANAFGFLGDCLAHGLGSGANREGVRSVLVLCERAFESALDHEGVTLFDLEAALKRAAPGHRHPDEREPDHADHD